jgi:hypothetical protein
MNLCAIKKASFRYRDDVIKYFLLSTVASVRDTEANKNRLTLHCSIGLFASRSVLLKFRRCTAFTTIYRILLVIMGQ